MVGVLLLIQRVIRTAKRRSTRSTRYWPADRLQIRKREESRALRDLSSVSDGMPALAETLDLSPGNRPDRIIVFSGLDAGIFLRRHHLDQKADRYPRLFAQAVAALKVAALKKVGCTLKALARQKNPIACLPPEGCAHRRLIKDRSD